ncbi:hypothetical protein LCGC14_1376170 [marine sediment metagenome]|uniref:Thioredoxin-like fold domain-containing protein n=1 Tax=marine sediment metagenome TaxID=412755 RepID=A0A0F9KPY5_9ZZZZ
MDQSDNEPVLECFAIEDDTEAFQCIKDLVVAGQQAGAEKGETCGPRILLFAQENCAPCAEEKARLQEDIDAGIVEVVDINTPEGLALAKKADIGHVPLVAIVDCEGEPINPV